MFVSRCGVWQTRGLVSKRSSDVYAANGFFIGVAYTVHAFCSVISVCVKVCARKIVDIAEILGLK